jgi:hypothetical protein
MREPTAAEPPCGRKRRNPQALLAKGADVKTGFAVDGQNGLDAPPKSTATPSSWNDSKAETNLADLEKGDGNEC